MDNQELKILMAWHYVIARRTDPRNDNLSSISHLENPLAPNHALEKDVLAILPDISSLVDRIKAKGA